MDIEIVKQKIKKLLALSKSPNENEAVAAMAKAQKLIEKYGLNIQSCIYNEKRAKATKIFNPWRSTIATAVAWLYNCYRYKDNGDMVFVGEDFEAFMAVEMYLYLSKTIERMAKQNIRKNAKRNFRESYKKGMANCLYNRIMTLGKSCSWANQRESKIKAVSDFVEKQVELVSANSKTKKVKVNWSAYARGSNNADGISLNRQATGHGGRYIAG